MREHRYRRGHRGGLAWGFVLIGLGVFFLLDQAGVMPGDWIRRAWPAWPAFFGIAKLVGARHASQVGGAISLLAISAYLFVSNEGLFGLTWATSWPLAIVAAGLGQLAGAIASRVMTEPQDAVDEAHHA